MDTVEAAPHISLFRQLRLKKSYKCVPPARIPHVSCSCIRNLERQSAFWLCIHTVHTGQLSLIPVILSFAFLAASDLMCAAGSCSRQLPTLLGYSTSDNTGRVGLASFLVFCSGQLPAQNPQKPTPHPRQLQRSSLHKPRPRLCTSPLGEQHPSPPLCPGCHLCTGYMLPHVHLCVQISCVLCPFL